MLNDLTIEEAIEVVIGIRDDLPLPTSGSLEEKWLKKDALAILINYAEEKRNEEKQKQS